MTKKNNIIPPTATKKETTNENNTESTIKEEHIPKGKEIGYANIEAYKLNKIPKEVARETQRKGAEASNKKQRELKGFRKGLEQLLSLQSVDVKRNEELKELGFDESELTNEALVFLALFKNVKKGNVASINLMSELMGQKIVKTQNESTVKIEDYFKDNKLDV